MPAGFLMDYYENGDLKKYVQENTFLPQRLIWMHQLASALAYLHENKITHGDVKPKNILVANSGESIMLNMSVNSVHENCFIPLDEDIVFKPPELLCWENEELCTEKADSYSYGMIMYFLIKKEYPHRELLASVKDGSLQDFSTLKQVLQADSVVIPENPLQHLMEKALQWESNNRPSMKSVQKELDGISWLLDEDLKKDVTNRGMNRMQHVPSTSSIPLPQSKIPQIGIETLQIFAVEFASMLGVLFKTEIANKEAGARVFPPTHRERLEELLETFSKLKHPNLIEIYAQVVEQAKEAVNGVRLIGFTMEYLAKGTLSNYTYKEESDRYNNIINPQRAYNWATQLADVMTYLHSQGFVHRRVSPQNIFVSEDKTTVKICPVCASTNPSNDVTTSDWLNTFGYIAPEVLLEKKYSKKSDVYSFGIVLYALENRRLPFDGQDIKFSKFGKHINNDNNRPPLKKDMNPVLRDIIVKCWKPNPEERPTMDQVLKLLRDGEHELAGADIPVVRMETIVYSSRLASSYGSMTFKGNIPEHKESVAIKVLGSRGRIRHIRREVNNLWKIDHLNIQRFIMLIKDADEIHGLIFEYMSKGSVGDYIFGEKDGYEDVCTPGRILKWFQQLANAVTYCHKLEIIHRNIKPNKMLLTDDLESIKLADFSMSREIDESMTNQAGSREYMAPEVIESETYTDKCDVYSFGMTLYACSNTERKNPFEDEIEETPSLKNRKMRMLEFLKAGNRPHIPIREQLLYLKPLFEKCWQTEAELRPAMKMVEIELLAFDGEPMEH